MAWNTKDTAASITVDSVMKDLEDTEDMATEDTEDMVTEDMAVLQDTSSVLTGDRRILCIAKNQ
jgi:hypothetical protein